MPSNSPDLTIELYDSKVTYSPGDQIYGSLLLQLPKDSVVGQVTVQLLGYTESEIAQPNGQSTSTFRHHQKFFNLEQVLHDDHFTHKSGSLEWKFAFEIPEFTDSSTSDQKWSQSPDFLTTDGQKQNLPLPPSLRFAEIKSSKGWHASNRYLIEATITEPEKSPVLKPKIRRSRQPIQILPHPTNSIIDMDDPQQLRGINETFAVRSLRLLPENTGTLTVMQRTRAYFAPSNVPKFTFEVDVSYPSLLQLYHPSSVPFVVAAIPKTDPDLTTIQPNMHTFYRYPALKIRRLQLSLQATTTCRCPSAFGEVAASTTHNISLVDRCFEDEILSMRSLAWDQKNNVENSVPTCIDFGKECDIFITRDNREVRKVSKKGKDKESAGVLICPSFRTSSIARKYHFVWTLEFECAREQMVMKGRSPEEVVVVGPAVSESGESMLDDAGRTVEPGSDSGGDEDGSPRRPSNRDTLPVYSELPGAELSVEGSRGFGGPNTEKRT